MRWLHITDLHIGKPNNASQKTAINSLLRSIENQGDGLLFQAILITGDIAYSGQSSEYQHAQDILLSKLLQLPPFRFAKIIAVPGNHDINCDLASPMQWDHAGKKRQENWFSENAEGVRTRHPRALGFQSFSQFVRSAGIEGPNPLEMVSYGTKLKAAQNVKIIATNTAFFSDREVTDEEKAPAPTASLRQCFDQLRELESDVCIVLGHHPIEWFTYSHREPFKSLLAHEHALYIHGHTHRVSTTFAEHGLQSFGFGACYATSQDADPQLYYRNQFAICEIAENRFHVKITEWSNEVGRWQIASNLPHEFKEASAILPGGYVFDIWRQGTPPRTSAPGKRRTAPQPESLICAERMDEEQWRKFLSLTTLTGSEPLTREKRIELLPGKLSFYYQAPAGRHWVDCISGSGHILSRSEVETANTNIDIQGFASYTIISFGEIADDAKAFYLQISTRKPIRIFAAADLVKECISSLNQRQQLFLNNQDAADVEVDLVYTEARFYLLFRERRSGEWFYLVSDDGAVVPESNEVVVRLRKSKLDLASSNYRDPGMKTSGDSAPLDAPKQFDREGYLSSCYKEFNSVRYSALSTFGFRFHDIPLDELYVPANADVNATDRTSTALSLAINSLLQEYNVDAPVRAHLEAQIRKNLGLGLSVERGAAKYWYQQLGSIIVVGDPGSGKTCFVKSEILAYCNINDDVALEKTWYSSHIPVYISLAEAARLMSEGLSLIEISAQLAAKRGLSIDPVHLQGLLTEGHVAYFWDGLDEVVIPEQRELLVQQLHNMIKEYRPLGNRFVITSRPAAIQFTELPESLRMLTLQGLSEYEMRVLANRVLAARHEGNEDLRIDVNSLQESDTAVVDQLLQDCNDIPGIGRLARNPLLLTLLIMIYINSRGAPSSKRHRIYAQAVQTLVSVRSREAGQRVLSEADLRKRLGAVALSIYRDSQGSIPSKEYVLKKFIETMSAQRGKPVPQAEAEQYLSDVAEATGLLVIHAAQSQDHDATVTFMHHSFLEYYAAAGLYASGRYLDLVPGLIDQPRWREVLILLGGMVSDSDDSVDLLATILNNQSIESRVTLDTVLFAFDCALESDVPSEGVQERLLLAAKAALRDGPALFDPYLRKQLGERLNKLHESSRSLGIEQFLIEGLSVAPSVERAAYIDIMGHVFINSELSEAVKVAFNASITARDNVILEAIFDVIGRMDKLQIDNFDELLEVSLRGNFQLRYAAAQALEEAPTLTKNSWILVLESIERNKQVVAASLSAALLKAGLAIDTSNTGSRLTLLRVLSCLEATAIPDTVARIPITCSRAQIDNWLSSPVQEERLIALRLLPWLKNEERLIQSRLMTIVRDSGADKSMLLAALSAFRLSKPVHRIISVADVVDVTRLLDDRHSRDVRVAACRVLAQLGSSIEAAEALKSYVDRHQAGGLEFRVGIYALVQSCPDLRQTQVFLLNLVRDRLRRGHANKGALRRGDGGSEGNADTRVKQNHDLFELLRACQRLTETDENMAGLLRHVIRNRSADEGIRQEALLLFARIATPGKTSVDFYVSQATGTHTFLRKPLYKSVAHFIQRSRGKIDYMRAVCPYLPTLRDKIVSHLDPKQSDYLSFIELESRVVELRRAIDEIQKIMRSYSEYANRKTLA